MPTLKLTPPAVDLWLYTGDTSTITFTWPTGELAGRTFAAAIIAPNNPTVTPAVSVSGDVITVVVAGTDVATLSGADARWELQETTTGRAEVVVAGAVKTTHKPGPPSLTQITVNEGAGLVTVEIAPFPLGWPIAIDGGTPAGTGAGLIDGGTP